MPLNTEWAIGELDRFLELTDGSFQGDPEDMGVWFVANGNQDQIVAQWAVARRILLRMSPDWVLSDEPVSAYEPEWKRQREAVLEAQALLSRKREIDENLGDKAPSLSASGFHPWVWEGARALWQSGYYRSAVEDAAKKVNAETQNKLGRRDVSEAELFKFAFSEDLPRVGGARLRRMAPEPGNKTYASMQRGARTLAEGIYAGIRNPLGHADPADLDEQVALEYLAALSILARWVDQSLVDSV